MTYGDDNSSSKDDDRVVSFITTVEFAPVEFAAAVAFIAIIPFIITVSFSAVGAIDDDDDIGDGVIVGDADEKVVSFIATVEFSLVEFAAAVAFIAIVTLIITGAVGPIDDDDIGDGVIVGDADDVGLTDNVESGISVELDDDEVELDDGSALALGGALVVGVVVGDTVTVGQTLPACMMPLVGGFDNAGPTPPAGVTLPELVEGTLPDDEGDIDIVGP